MSFFVVVLGEGRNRSLDERLGFGQTLASRDSRWIIRFEDGIIITAFNVFANCAYELKGLVGHVNSLLLLSM